MARNCWRLCPASIGNRDGMSVPQLLSRLYGELMEHRGDIPNFSSFRRVCGLRYLALQVDQRIPCNVSIPIRSLNAHAVLRGLRPSGWTKAMK